MSSVVISGDSSGAITLAAPSVAGINTITLPAATGTAMVSGNMPAFNCVPNGSQGVTSASETICQFQTKVFDTNNCYNNTSSTQTLNGLSVPAWAFMPNIAGYYVLTFTMRVAGGVTSIYGGFYKNNSRFFVGISPSGSLTDGSLFTCSEMVYLNGSTDYIQAFGNITGTTSPQFQYNSQNSSCVYSGALVRAS